MSGIDEGKNVNSTPTNAEEMQGDQHTLESAPVKQGVKDKCAGLSRTFCAANTVCDGILDKVRKLPTEKYFSAGVEWAVKIGAVAFTVGGAVAALAAVVEGIKADSIRTLLIGILVAAPACVVFSFVGGKLFHGIIKLIENFPSRFTSRAFPDCIALVSLFAAASAIVVCVLGGISRQSWVFFAGGLVIAVACGFIGLLAASPKTLSMEIVEQCSPAEELIGIMSFNIKALLLSAPFIWCAGSVVLVFSLISSLFKGDLTELIHSPMLIILLGLLPALVYQAFLAFAFSIDIARAILSLPAKLDSLKKERI